MKKKAFTINLCPTWESLVPSFLALLSDGDTEGQRIAREEVLRMARVADLYVKEKGK